MVRRRMDGGSDDQRLYGDGGVDSLSVLPVWVLRGTDSGSACYCRCLALARTRSSWLCEFGR